MKKPKLTLAAALAVAALAGTWGIQTLDAQQPGFTRVPLQDQDLTVAPGGEVGKHTHPGEEVGYVLEGTLQLEVASQPTRTLKAGEAFFIPAGVVHSAKNVDKGTAKLLATSIVEKGKPLATPVK